VQDLIVVVDVDDSVSQLVAVEVNVMVEIRDSIRQLVALGVDVMVSVDTLGVTLIVVVVPLVTVIVGTARVCWSVEAKVSVVRGE
jgi:hypothetical protein